MNWSSVEKGDPLQLVVKKEEVSNVQVVMHCMFSCGRIFLMPTEGNISSPVKYHQLVFAISGKIKLANCSLKRTKLRTDIF